MLDDIRNECQSYDKFLHKLQNMHLGANTHLNSLQRRGQGHQDDSEADTTGLAHLTTLAKKTLGGYVQEGLVLRLDSLIEDSASAAMTITELRQNPLVLTEDL